MVGQNDVSLTKLTGEYCMANFMLREADRIQWQSVGRKTCAQMLFA